MYVYPVVWIWGCNAGNDKAWAFRINTGWSGHQVSCQVKWYRMDQKVAKLILFDKLLSPGFMFPLWRTSTRIITQCFSQPVFTSLKSNLICLVIYRQANEFSLFYLLKPASLQGECNSDFFCCECCKGQVGLIQPAMIEWEWVSLCI